MSTGHPRTVDGTGSDAGWLPGVLVAVGVGSLAALVAATTADLPLKALFYRAAAVGLTIGAIVSGRPRRVLLFAFAVTLTYNRSYFLDSVFGNHGSYGPYWIPADIPLAGLLGLWAYEAAVGKRAPSATAPRTWPWFLPFAAACLLSVALAERIDWGMFEMVRVIRIGLILAYVRFNVRREDWYWAAAGLACAVLLQALLGLVFALTGSRIGVTAVLGLSPGAERWQALSAEVDANFGFRRAEGTFGHPNTMAVYFLLLFPLFAALGSVLRSGWLRAACWIVAAAALAGMGTTMSRTSWVLGVGQLGLLGLGLVGLGLVTAKRAIGAAVLVACLGTIALIPLADTVQRRFLGNLRESVDFRLRHDRAALDIWSSSPLTGVGLNNYSHVLQRYGFEDVAVFLKLGEEARLTLGIRATAWVHNIYLLMLGETGLIGLSAFLLLLGGALWRACRAIAVTDGPWRAAGLGIAVGLLGLYAHGLQESVFWIDPITCTFALVAGLANQLPAMSAGPPPALRRISPPAPGARLRAEVPGVRRPA